jgi:hypothetical protein
VKDEPDVHSSPPIGEWVIVNTIFVREAQTFSFLGRVFAKSRDALKRWETGKPFMGGL